MAPFGPIVVVFRTGKLIELALETFTFVYFTNGGVLSDAAAVVVTPPLTIDELFNPLLFTCMVCPFNAPRLMNTTLLFGFVLLVPIELMIIFRPCNGFDET